MDCPTRFHRIQVAAHAAVDERAVARVYRQQPTTTSVYTRVVAAAAALGMTLPPAHVEAGSAKARPRGGA